MIKFGTDGWRAVIAKDFTFDNLEIVSQAIADYLKKEKKGKKRVVIGFDRRFLSEEFAETVGLVLAANNITVTVSDRAVPTPVVSFHCLYKKFDLGIMITASHNPAIFNGLKIKSSSGGSADKAVTNKVESLLGKRKPKTIDVKKAKSKNKLQIKDLTKPYLKFIKDFLNISAIRKLNAKVLVDVMYGSGDHFVSEILGKSKVKVDYINDEHNPSFGGIHPEPTEENIGSMLKKMKKGNYDIGLVLDGDADRLAVVDSKGNYVNAQVILPLLLVHMVKNRKAKKGIGKTVVGSNVIDKVAVDLDIACYETPVGFKYLSTLFKQKLIDIGGEEAGGVGVAGYVPERDGSVSFLLLLEMMAKTKKSFDKLLEEFYKKYGKYYYQRIAVPVKNLKNGLKNLKIPKKIANKEVKRVNKLDGIKIIAKDCWLMFRESGTEPIVRVYAESSKQKEAKELILQGKKIIDAL
ncbi:MAG: phosphoglucomutase/phosphomannomutase family protein [Candidatus Omnitrophica bacterium]|nr:phosphoglucomutase/phosphomannomutase family protein [Candidatus Omnitrophota bacterium]MCF7893961.1 phosphoglucomutase/phosphomannomutase family protein [Candidatus Omnitrophota bacterium]